MITQIREKKETGFSLLELSVAVGVSAIVATAGIVATTAFIGSAQDKRDSYTDRANSSVEEAEAASRALIDGLYNGGGSNPLLNFAYSDAIGGSLAFTRGQASQSFMPNGAYEGATYSLTNGSLPAGVTLNSTTGALTGPSSWGLTPISGLVSPLNHSTMVTYLNNGNMAYVVVSNSEPMKRTVNIVNPSGNNIVTKNFTSTSTTLQVLGLEPTVDDGFVAFFYNRGGAQNGNFTLGTLNHTGQTNKFIVKFDSQGNPLWASSIVDTNFIEKSTSLPVNSTVSLDTDNNGNVYYASGPDGNYDNGTLGMVYVKLNGNDGSLAWSTKVPFTGGANISPDGDNQNIVHSASITNDGNGGAIVFGRYINEITLGSTVLTATERTTLSGATFVAPSGFVAKLSNNGEWEWASKIEIYPSYTGFYYSDYIRFSDMALVNDGVVLVGELYNGTVLHNETANDITIQAPNAQVGVIAKISHSGEWEWAEVINKSFTDVREIESLPDNSIIVAGSIFGGYNFSPTVSVPGGCRYEAFIAKMDANREWQWANNIANSAGCGGGDDTRVRKIDVSNSGQTVILDYAMSAKPKTAGNNVISDTGWFIAGLEADGQWMDSISGSTEEVTITVSNETESKDYVVTVSTE